MGAGGVTVTSDNKVLVASFAGPIYLFSDVDGLSVENALKVNVQFPGLDPGAPGSTPCLAYSNNVVYLTTGRKLYSLNSDGSGGTVLLNGASVTSLGLAPNPANGHLYANASIDPSSNLADIDPATNSYVLRPGPGGLMMSVSPDGKTAYTAGYPVVLAYDTTTWNPVWTSTPITGYASAMATIPTGPLAGQLIGYNEVFGELLLFDPTNGDSIVIGTGGDPGVRGFLSVDPTNNTILFSDGESVLRINPVPEPAAVAWIGGASLVAVMRRHRR